MGKGMSLVRALEICNDGDVLECVEAAHPARFTVGKKYIVTTGRITDRLCIENDSGDKRTHTNARFELVQSLGHGAEPQETTEEPQEEYDTWGIGNKPHKKVKPWEPDTIRDDIDIMDSIRRASNRL